MVLAHQSIYEYEIILLVNFDHCYLLQSISMYGNVSPPSAGYPLGKVRTRTWDVKVSPSPTEHGRPVAARVLAHMAYNSRCIWLRLHSSSVKAAQDDALSLQNNGTPFYTKAVIADIIQRFDCYRAESPADKIIEVTDVRGRYVRLIVVKRKASEEDGQFVK